LTNHRLQTRAEEWLNTLTHGSGFAASLVGLPLLIWAASTHGDTLQLVACIVFAATLIAMYAASTLYHVFPPSPTKDLLRLIDHGAIYLLIAGSYTPFTIGLMRGGWGWSLFGVVWAIALMGVFYKILFGFRHPRLSLLIYVGMGWLAVVAAVPLMRALPAGALIWLVAGGLCYTVGVPFYARQNVRYFHAIWHLFVLGGSVCHFVAVHQYATIAPL
jgi:hemolysin III